MMTRQRCRVLVVDDEAAMREVLEARLEKWGFPVETAGSAREAGQHMERFDPHLVISDLVLPDGTGLDLLRTYRNAARRFVMITAYGTVDTAVQAMKGGAAEFLTKPLDYTELRALIEAHDECIENDEEEGSEALAPSHDGGSLVGRGPAMAAVRRHIDAVGPSATTVLIVGESGTGKELVARSIHDRSKRAGGPFVAVNAAAIPASLVEGELLGHDRGAFTGAERERAGLFEQAHRGTLFLDEITEMPLDLQAKLLRVLEDGRVRRVGGSKEIDCDVRVVAATNRAPEEALDEGRLRTDLYHRLCVFRIDLPPLRQRKEDIPLLAQHLLAVLAHRHDRAPPSLGADALAKLLTHGYPGNVRELRNLLERALVVTSGPEIGAEQIGFHATTPPMGVAPTEGITLPSGVTAADAERILIIETLKRVGNNKAEAARRLGLDVKTIRNKLKSFSREEE